MNEKYMHVQPTGATLHVDIYKFFLNFSTNPANEANQ